MDRIWTSGNPEQAYALVIADRLAFGMVKYCI